MAEDSDSEPVVVTVDGMITTEEGTYEVFEAKDHTEKNDCMAFFGTDISRGTVRVEKDNLRSVVYL